MNSTDEVFTQACIAALPIKSQSCGKSVDGSAVGDLKVIKMSHQEWTSYFSLQHEFVYVLSFVLSISLTTTCNVAGLDMYGKKGGGVNGLTSVCT